MKRLRAAKSELAAAKASKNKAAQKRLEGEVNRATARLTRVQAAVELGIIPAGAVAVTSAPATAVMPAPVPPVIPSLAPGLKPIDPVVATVATVAAMNAAPKKPGTPPQRSGATVTTLPVTSPPVTVPAGPGLNGNTDQGGTRAMTAPTPTTPVGEVTTIDQALTAYENAVGGMTQISDEQGQAADAAEAMVILFEGAAGALNLDDDSGNEIAAAMDALRHVAELTKALAAAATDAASLLENNQKALDTRYAFREQVAALKGGDAMQLSSLRAS